MTSALVTGATAGIGREFAEQLAARGHDLVLVARDESRLEVVAEELRRAHGIRCEVLSADLSVPEDLQRVAARVASSEAPVEIVVNNAGFGVRTPFLDTPIEQEEQLLDVLCRATMVLSHAAGRAMRERGHGTIINVSSVAGWIISGTYSAAKAWTTVFTEGLAGQLRGSGVTVTVLCPGFTHTEFHDRMGEKFEKTREWMWLDAADLVRDCLADVDAGKVISTPSLVYQGVRLLTRFAPRRLLRMGAISRTHRPGSQGGGSGGGSAIPGR